ncbi:DegQ family serine endoprotease [Vulgatibacter sp.]|uniref:DegQ family serine endoprotease n=1 Tax=Vulgatibacter sp. TaxID=1971226 RepID=UPI0035637529
MSFKRGVLVGVATSVAIAASVAATTPVSFDGSVAEAKSAPALWHERNDSPQPVLANGFSPLPSLAPLIKDLKPAVVSVSTSSVVRRRRGVDPFEEFFRPYMGNDPRNGQSRVVPRGQGSGFVIHESGLVLTNNHVIDGADRIDVKLADGREFEGKVVGRDPKTDVALLRLENARNLPTVYLGDSDKADVGDWVVAIGNPFGLSHSVSVGIVSAKERFIGAGPYDDFIQTDAAINPGNSGGPLFNARGEVIGINTAIAAHGQGIGFAVPINLVKVLVPQLEETGTVARGWLGVAIQDLTPELARSLKLPQKSKGALIADVVAGGPAERAGLQHGDLVVSVDGREIDDYAQLSRTIALLPPGKAIRLGVLRDGKRTDVDVAVAARDDQGRVLDAKAERRDGPGSEAGPLGISVREVTPEVARSMRLARPMGVLVAGVASDGPAARAGINEGDLILEVNRRPVRSLRDWRDLVGSVSAGEMVLLRLQRGESAIYVAVRNG